MRLVGWLLVGTFICGVLVCLNVLPGAILMVLFAVATFSPLMNLLDQQADLDDDEPEDDDDDEDGGSDRVPPGDPWWPSGVCQPDDDLVGV